MRAVAGQAVDVAVGRHDRAEARRPHGGLEREELLVAQLTRTDVDRRLVEAALGEPVADHVLAGREHALREVGALQPVDVGDPQRGGQIRVLAVGLLDPSPARVAGHVEDGCQAEPRTGQQHPSAERLGHGLDELRVPGRRGADGLLERRRIAREQAVEGLLVDECRDPEARLLTQVVLDLVARHRDVDGVQVRGAGEPRDLADPVVQELAMLGRGRAVCRCGPA